MKRNIHIYIFFSTAGLISSKSCLLEFAHFYLIHYYIFFSFPRGRIFETEDVQEQAMRTISGTFVVFIQFIQ